MFPCAVSASLAHHYRDLARSEAFDDLVRDVLRLHRSALAVRLMRCRRWVLEVVAEQGDTLSDLAQALDYATRGDNLQAAAMIRRAFEPAAREKAEELIEKACEAFADEDGGQAPTADTIDLGEWE